MNGRVPLHKVCMLNNDRLLTEEAIAMRLGGSSLLKKESVGM